MTEAELLKKVSVLEGRMEELVNRISEYKTENANLKTELKASRDTLHLKEQGWKTEKEDAGKTGTQIAEKLKTLETENSTLKGAVEKSEKELSKLKAAAEEAAFRKVVYDELGSYEFKNAFEKGGFEKEMFSRGEDGNFLPHDTLKKKIKSFLESVKKGTETPPDAASKNKAEDHGNKGSTDISTKSTRIVELLKKPVRTRDEMGELMRLESEIEIACRAK